MSKPDRSIPTFGLLFGATVWGIIWYPYRLLEQAGISGVASSLYTYSIALMLGALLFALRRRGLTVVPASIFWLALAAGWTNLSYVLAVIDGEVMRVMLLFYLSPFWTLLLARLMLDERVGLVGTAVVVLSLCGAALMLWQPESGLPLPQNTAEWLGLSSGMGFALTNVLTRKSTHLTLQAKSLAVWVGVVAMALLFLPFESRPLPLPGEVGLSGLLLMGGIALLLMLATLLVQYGVTHMPVTRASVIFLFELVVAAVTSYFLAHEVLSVREWVGGAMIVAAALFAARMEEHA
ncbi:MAG TPA: DMT family transporter [Methylophilaceae bacterium]|nr:DMT family transporter [Methylophilaceae bacterium]